MFIIFDTEYTAWKETQKKGYNMVTQFPEIVQIGALKVDKDFKIVDKLNMYIKFLMYIFSYINVMMSIKYNSTSFMII